MSYQRPDTGNSMNDFFTALSDFVKLSPNLLEASTPESFETWLDRLIEIDRRSLVLFIEKNREKIPPEHMARAEAKLGRWL